MNTVWLCALILAAAPANDIPEDGSPTTDEVAADSPAEPSGEPEPGEAPSADPAEEVPNEDNPIRVVVPDLEAQGVDADLAANLTNVVLTRLSQLPNLEIVARRDLANLLDQDRQRQLVGCGDDAACLSDLAGALDATRLLTGSVGKIGDRYILSLALLDTSDAKLIRRISRQTIVVDSLVDAANEATVALWATGEVQIERCVDCSDTRLSKKWEAAIKIGNNFSTFFKRELNVDTLTLGLDIDVGYRMWTSVALFGSVGIRLTSVERTADGRNVGMQVLPMQVGARYHTPKFLGGLSAYFAAAIGLGFLRTSVNNDQDLITAFSARTYAGLVYALGTRIGLLAEVSYELTAKRSEELQASRLDAAALRLGLSYGF